MGRRRRVRVFANLFLGRSLLRLEVQVQKHFVAGRRSTSAATFGFAVRNVSKMGTSIWSRSSRTNCSPQLVQHLQVFELYSVPYEHVDSSVPVFMKFWKKLDMISTRRAVWMGLPARSNSTASRGRNHLEFSKFAWIQGRNCAHSRWTEYNSRKQIPTFSYGIIFPRRGGDFRQRLIPLLIFKTILLVFMKQFDTCQKVADTAVTKHFLFQLSWS